MDITVGWERGIAVVSLAGRLDSCAAEEFGRRLDSVLEEKSASVVLDGAALTFISSAGLRVLLLLSRRLQQAQQGLVLCSLSENVGEVFQISGLTKIFTPYPTRSEAVAALAK